MSILSKIANEEISISNSGVIIKVGTIYSKIIGKVPSKTLSKIDKKLSYWFIGAQYSKAYKDGIWDGYIHLFSIKGRYFPTGFLNEVENVLKKRKIDYHISDLRPKIKINKQSIQKAINFHKNIIPRPYQIEALKKALSEKTGIINIPTGTGKTLLINLIINSIDQETKFEARHLIISIGLSLLGQLKREIEKFQKTNVGFIGENKFDVNRITVASIDSLYSIITTKKFDPRKEKVMDLLENSTSLFLDEAHHSPAKTFKQIVQKSKASFRIGTTATYKRSGGDDMMLKAVTGNIIYKRSISWMIKSGYLAIPTIFLIEFRGEEKKKSEIDKIYQDIKSKSGKKISDKDIKKMKDWHKIYTVEIANNKKRNKLISNVFKILYGFDLSIVLFVFEKLHGEYFVNKFRKSIGLNNDIRFLSGIDDVNSVRTPVLKSFRDGNIRSLICTRILNEGIDFPEANCGIRAGGLAFEGSIIQQLGRVLRKIKDPGKQDIDKSKIQRIFWIDICDFHHPILAKHSLERISTYEKQKRFNIVYIDDLEDMKTEIKEHINEVKIIQRKNKKNSSS